MSGLIYGFFSLMGSVIKYSFYTTVFGVVGIGGIAWYTKPIDADFHTFLRKYIQDNIEKDRKSTGIIGQVFASGITAVATKISTVDIKDCVFFKFVTVRIGDKQMRFIGAVNNWFAMNNN